MDLERYQTKEQHGAAGVMVTKIHRVMSLCVIVLLTGSVFRTQAVATDSRVRDLAQKAGIRILRDSSSDKQLQKAAAAQVPLARMSQQSQQRAIHLLKNTSQYRRMHTLQYEVDASLYQYLINHPDVAIATWRVMDISKLNMWQTAPFKYSAEANDGSKGRADVLWRDGNQCLFVVEGAYHSPLLPSAIEASALVWMRYRFERTRDNRILVNQQIETFINFPSPGIEAIAKLASMMTNSILDRNVMEVSLYAQMMSRAVKKDANWVEEVAARMDGVPEHRKIELTRVARGMNPYESQPMGRIARQAAKQPAVSPSDSPLMAKTTDATLSPSKQQLLQAVRAGNVVVIVRPSEQSEAAMKHSKIANQTAAVGTLANRKLLPTQLDPNDAAQVRSVMSASLEKTLHSSKDVLTIEAKETSTSAEKQPLKNGVALSESNISGGQAQAGETNKQHLPASGPIAESVAKRTSMNSRDIYTGHSKNGSAEIAEIERIVTGPIKSTSAKLEAQTSSYEMDEAAATAEQKTASRCSTAIGSNGDQPALVTLPPVTVDE